MSMLFLYQNFRLIPNDAIVFDFRSNIMYKKMNNTIH
jgi:hypothetical protein